MAAIGYPHPLHPVISHITIGMVIGGFIFGFLAWILQKQNLSQTAHHCISLAVISAIPNAALGYMDWQQFYDGAWMIPIRWKLILAALLLVLLLIAWLSGRKKDKVSFSLLIIYILCLGGVLGLGYFAGDLVYEKKISAVEQKSHMGNLVWKGADYFERNCSICHFIDSTDTKIGPGLKGLCELEKLPVSQRPFNGQNIEKQIENPYENMPSFDDITPEKINAIISYLKTL